MQADLRHCCDSGRSARENWVATHRLPCPRMGQQPNIRWRHACAPASREFARRVYHRDDEEKEAARRARRTMFTFADWTKHRSAARYLHHIATIAESGVARAVVRPVVYVTSLSLAIAAYCAAHAAKASWLPSWAPAAPIIAIEPIQLTSIALSLLLVFRTNASYSRWDEARRKFGAITTTSRDIARQAFSWFPVADMAGKAYTARWLMALCRSCMCHLRGDEHDLRSELASVLPPDEMNMLQKSVHRPNFCLQMLTRIMAGARIPSELLIRMDENMSKLVEAVSGCERIINTPIPLSYTRHTARFLMAWLACMPFTLWNYCGWAMVPLTALISFVLLGIEEIGVYIEEPFSVMFSLPSSTAIMAACLAEDFGFATLDADFPGWLALERLCDRLDMMINSMMQEHHQIDQYLQRPGEASMPLQKAPPRAPVVPSAACDSLGSHVDASMVSEDPVVRLAF